MGLLNLLFGPKVNFTELIKNGAVVIDVRSRGEYDNGHVKGSVNIPLDSLQNNLNKIKNMKKPLIMCCASGMRSGRATNYLKKEGIVEVYNGGSWRNL